MSKKSLRIIAFFTVLAISVLVGVGLVYSYFYYQFWTHVDTSRFKVLVDYSGPHLTGHRGRQILINKSFLPQMKRLEAYAQQHNIEIKVIQGYRNPGQSLQNTVVEPATKSNHFSGFAIDFNIRFKGKTFTSVDMKKNNLNELPSNIQAFFDLVRRDMDLRWGGDFYREDPVHIDSPLNDENPEKWAQHSNSCSKDYVEAIPVWKKWANNMLP